jgi:hypothetical protein
VSCDPERVTGFVDGELDPQEAAAVAAHLEGCPDCRAQAAAEGELRARLARLPLPAMPEGLEARVVGQAVGARRPAPTTTVRWALPLAAALFVAVWLRGYAPLVAWDLARDHDKCFGRHPVPARVWSAEPDVVADWFEAGGSHLPALPAELGGLKLVGARYCPLLSVGSAPHVYYASATGGQVSVFVVPHAVRFDARFASRPRGDFVRLLRLEGEVVGIVGAHQPDVQAFETSLRPLITGSTGAAR